MNNLGNGDEDIQDDEPLAKDDNGMPLHSDNPNGYFNEGFENGKAGSDSDTDLGGDFIPPSENEREARERGYEAGKLAAEINSDDEDDDA